jgi:hypothetical protein
VATTNPPREVGAVPQSMPTPEPLSIIASPVKVATPELVITGEAPMTVEEMTDLVFEKIGGHEIINLLRLENVNGINASYQPIRNVAQLAAEYGPITILPLPRSTNFYFNGFAIDLLARVPQKGLGANIYIEATQAGPSSLVIEVANMKPEERVEVEIIKTKDAFNDTIV